MEPGQMTIGTFSRASGLSVKSLRAYHEAGLLVPASVDPSSGYRTFTVDQLADAAVIVKLRALDLPLARIREVLTRRDPEFTATVLAEHHAHMNTRLAETVRIVSALQEGAAASTYTSVHLREEPALQTVRLCRTVSEDELWSWLGAAHRRILAGLAASGTPPTGPPSALYLPEIAEDGIEYVEAFVPVADTPPILDADPELSLGEVPAGRTAVLVHEGPYESLDETYRVLGAWVARHAIPSGERIRERYVVGRADAASDGSYRTEVAWPVATRVGSAGGSAEAPVEADGRPTPGT